MIGISRYRAAFAALALTAAILPTASFAQGAPAQGAVDPAKLALARQIIAVMFPPEKRDAMMASLLDTILAQYRASVALPAGFNDPGLKQIMDGALTSIPARLRPVIMAHLPAMHEAVARAYTREFSAAELTDIVAFAKTPTGQHYFFRATAVMSDPDVAAANTAYFTDVNTISQQMGGELQRQVNDYLTKHPDVAAKLRSTPPK